MGTNKRKPTNLGERIEQGSQAYTNSDISSLLFVAKASYYGWHERLNTRRGFALVVKTIECLPPMTFFGLGPGEMKALREALGQAHRPARAYQSWVAMRDYTSRPMTAGILSITNQGHHYKPPVCPVREQPMKEAL